MLKAIKIILAAGALLTAGSSLAIAQVDVTERKSIVTGVVTEIDAFGRVTIQSGANDFQLDTSELGLSASQTRNLLQKGMEVQVVGDLRSGGFNNDFTIEADRITVLGQYQGASPRSNIVILGDQVTR